MRSVIGLLELGVFLSLLAALSACKSPASMESAAGDSSIASVEGAVTMMTNKHQGTITYQRYFGSPEPYPNLLHKLEAGLVYHSDIWTLEAKLRATLKSYLSESLLDELIPELLKKSPAAGERLKRALRGMIGKKFRANNNEYTFKQEDYDHTIRVIRLDFRDHYQPRACSFRLTSVDAENESFKVERFDSSYDVVYYRRENSFFRGVYDVEDHRKTVQTTCPEDMVGPDQFRCIAVKKNARSVVIHPQNQGHRVEVVGSTIVKHIICESQRFKKQYILIKDHMFNPRYTHKALSGLDGVRPVVNGQVPFTSYSFFAGNRKKILSWDP